MKPVIAGVLLLISLPALLALGEAVSFHLRNRSDHVLVSSGVEREYMLHVPKSYDRTKPAPLVISLHGAGGWPRQQMELSKWNDLADREGFLVVYPAGAAGRGPRVWRMGGTAERRDVRFIADLIDELRKTYNIDPRRIYANGLSNGGGMSFILSCRLPDRIAAVGLVGAAQTAPWSSCADDHAVPMIDFHGTADPMAPYDGGSSWVAPDPFPSVPKWAANWARRNHCAPHPIDSQMNAEVTRREYTGCTDDASVVLYSIRGGGHTWPGGQPLPEWFAGRTSTSIDATREMWAFFQAHPLRRRVERRQTRVHRVDYWQQGAERALEIVHPTNAAIGSCAGEMPSIHDCCANAVTQTKSRRTRADAREERISSRLQQRSPRFTASGAMRRSPRSSRRCAVT